MKKILYFVLTICVSVLSGINSWAADFGDVQIGGFVSQGYLQTDHNNFLADTKRGSFEFNEMGINFQTYPADKVMVGLQLFARDLGDVGNDAVELSWAFGEYSWREWMGVRAGILKVPFGFYNETRDYDLLRTSVLLPGSVYMEWMRDGINNIKGIQFFGNVDLSKAGMLKYQIMGGDLPVSNEDGTALLIKQSSATVASVDSIDIDKLYHGQIIWVTPLDGLRLAYNYTYYDELINQFTLVNGLSSTVNYEKSVHQVGSIEYLFRNLLLSAEYYKLEFDRKTAIPAAGIYFNSPKFKSGDRYYIGASYRFTDWFETGAYYSMYEHEKDLSGASNELEDICLSLRFDLNEAWLAKFEIHKMDGLFGVFPEEDGTTDEDWMLYAVKLSYSF